MILRKDPRYALLREQMLRFALTNASDEEKQKIKEIVDLLDKEIDADDASTILSAIRDLPTKNGTMLSKAYNFLQSPPFYFFFGLLLIYVAFASNEHDYNSSLTFIVAMLGVAILLYGTGSQAAGTFGTSTADAQRILSEYRRAVHVDQAARGNNGEQAALAVASQNAASQVPAAANVAIAGGAAVLTAFFGWAVVNYADGIRQVFRDYDKYALVEIDFCTIEDELCKNNEISAGDNSNRSGAESVSLNVLRELANNATLQTLSGRHAYSRMVGDGLEFIVLTRDLGKKKRIKLEASVTQEGQIYSTYGDFFTIEADQDTANNVCLASSPTRTCMVKMSEFGPSDGERVPRYTIKAIVAKSSTITGSGVVVPSEPFVAE